MKGNLDLSKLCVKFRNCVCRLPKLFMGPAATRTVWASGNTIKREET